jgi:hypothetical protein
MFAAIALLAIVAVLAGVMDRSTPSVPDVTGMRRQEAVDALLRAGFCVGHDSGTVGNVLVPGGTVASQNPRGGELATEGSVVGIRGPDPIDWAEAGIVCP